MVWFCTEAVNGSVLQNINYHDIFKLFEAPCMEMYTVNQEYACWYNRGILTYFHKNMCNNGFMDLNKISNIQQSKMLIMKLITGLKRYMSINIILNINCFDEAAEKIEM